MPDEALISVFVDYENLALGVRDAKIGDFQVLVRVESHRCFSRSSSSSLRFMYATWVASSSACTSRSFKRAPIWLGKSLSIADAMSSSSAMVFLSYRVRGWEGTEMPGVARDLPPSQLRQQLRHRDGERALYRYTSDTSGRKGPRGIAIPWGMGRRPLQGLEVWAVHGPRVS